MAGSRPSCLSAASVSPYFTGADRSAWCSPEPNYPRRPFNASQGQNPSSRALQPSTHCLCEPPYPSILGGVVQ